MAETQPREPPAPTSRGGLLRYALVWLAPAGATTALALVLLGGGGDAKAPSDLPPVRQTQLDQAARASGCRLVAAGAARRANPRVAGARRSAAPRPGVYGRAPSEDRLVSALREGTIVIHYRPTLPAERREQLTQLQRDAPAGTIVVPNATAMPYELAVAGWQRLLGCRRFDDRTLDAMRLFQGRFVGRGPDAP